MLVIRNLNIDKSIITLSAIFQRLRMSKYGAILAKLFGSNVAVTF